tara:strand:- start:1049 stop:1813 length:765 start_codon:yes stop_codon:yes gene_type:complete
MPNWCQNTVTIAGSQEKITEIKKLVAEYNSDASKTSVESKGFLSYCKPEPDYTTVPVKKTYPKEGETDEPTVRTNSWWDFRLQNWGTKWEVEARVINSDDQEIILGFESAWSPPIEAYNNLLNQEGIISVSALYYEPSMDFAGRYKDGEEDLIQISLLSLPDIESDDTVIELDDAFNLYQDIMRCRPLQLHPEYKQVLLGLGVDDCWDIDYEDVKAIYQALKGEDISAKSIGIKENKFGHPESFTFKNKEYYLL